MSLVQDWLFGNVWKDGAFKKEISYIGRFLRFLLFEPNHAISFPFQKYGEEAEGIKNVIEGRVSIYISFQPMNLS